MNEKYLPDGWIDQSLYRTWEYGFRLAPGQTAVGWIDWANKKYWVRKGREDWGPESAIPIPTEITDLREAMMFVATIARMSQ